DHPAVLRPADSGSDRYLYRDRHAPGRPVGRLRHLLVAGPVPRPAHQPAGGGRPRRSRSAQGPDSRAGAREQTGDRDHAGAGVHVDLERVPDRADHDSQRPAAHRPAGSGELPGPVHRRDRAAGGGGCHRGPAHRHPVPVPPTPFHPRNARRSLQVTTDETPTDQNPTDQTPADPTPTPGRPAPAPERPAPAPEAPALPRHDLPAGSSTPAPPEAAELDDWDPLATQRTPEDPPPDVLLSGTAFFDIVFTGMERLPQPGEELWSKGMGSSPGGIANLATA